MDVRALPVPADDGPQGTGKDGGTGGGWRDLRLRLLSAVVLAPLALGCIRGGGRLFEALVLLVLIGLGAEWAGLLRRPLVGLRGVTLLLWPAIACLAALVTGRWEEAVAMLAAPLVLGPAIAAGTVAVGVAGLALLWLREGPAADPGWDGMLFVVLAVWASDSCAYLAGRALGGPRLAPRISPAKTWSGSLGGLGGAMLLGAILALLLPAPPALAVPARIAGGLLAALLLSLAAQAGDLAESAFKRRSGVKDSGRLIPGHGGLLDRLDGLLAAAPVAALLSLASPAGTGFWCAFPGWIR